MIPYFEDNLIKLYKGDARYMTELPDNSVQCVVTSPPYWGLRKYFGLPDLIWGGDDRCEHRFDLPTMAVQGNNSMVRGKDETDSGNFAIPKFKDTDMKQRKEIVGQFCSLCGAWKGQYGLELTPEMYIEHTLVFLREIRRVLRKDGVMFWNIGDSYMGSGCGTNDYRTEASRSINKSDVMFTKKPPQQKRHLALKPKDLCLIPFRVAIEAQRDGWWVRSVIIWSKPNPMPESVTDRPTESHEYILMLTRNKNYYWDAEAVREGDSHYLTEITSEKRFGGDTVIGRPANRKGRIIETTGRNIRSVWEFPTQPYPEAHFAVFPEKLPEICIKAGSKEGDLILDPFCGSGTTLWVAKKLGRRAVGYELSQDYCELALNRNRQGALI